MAWQLSRNRVLPDLGRSLDLPNQRNLACHKLDPPLKHFPLNNAEDLKWWRMPEEEINLKSCKLAYWNIKEDSVELKRLFKKMRKGSTATLKGYSFRTVFLKSQFYPLQFSTVDWKHDVIDKKSKDTEQKKKSSQTHEKLNIQLSLCHTEHTALPLNSHKIWEQRSNRIYKVIRHLYW